MRLAFEPTSPPSEMDGLVLDLGSGSGQEFMRGFDVECSSRADKHVSVSVFRPGQQAPLSQ